MLFAALLMDLCSFIFSSNWRGPGPIKGMPESIWIDILTFTFIPLFISKYNGRVKQKNFLTPLLLGVILVIIPNKNLARSPFRFMELDHSS